MSFSAMMKSCHEDEVQKTVTEFGGVSFIQCFVGELFSLQILHVFLSFFLSFFMSY